ncbi:Connector enhancer of kinase suppressor of ras 3 [Frankliniella fusca]|uniref:Connector enhancer of kinase suppressor of ras 3 n=1 Tax=Frankliniella fusca TaxID=407009 RepID=A0AAE1HSX2_9NEOP|nr:Connector enhancer of kinase suppressor of ras 3 [Frankliniella fusca]
MAYVNVAEWKPDQVTEWLKGLDSSILPYLQLFLANDVNGQLLLNFRSEDLDNLGIKRLGHQELILEAVEHLRNFHYELDRENLQLLALRLSCQAHSLHNELRQLTDSQPVSTQTLADVASVVRAVKPLVCWLDRSPFSGQLEYADRKSDLLKCSLEIATCAQRDRFAERPVEEIRTSCEKLAGIADGIIQDIADPLILQPASLDLATLRKKGGDDLGFFIVPSFHGIHQIGEIKFGSPAHQCGKVEEGDEVVQVNYQTVVGWQRKKVMALFEESSSEVFLTLKKRPRHTKVYGQIYIKPYRLPSKKRAPAYTRWHDNLPSPRPELLTIPDFEIPVSRAAPKTPPSKHIALEPLTSTNISTSSESDDAGSGCDEASIDYELEGHTSPTSMRLYLPKPRVPVQRRATITGSSPTAHLPPVDLEKFWKELKLEKKWKYSGKTPDSHNSNPECRVLRNKSPCEQNERPSTCLGFEKSSSKDYIKQVDYVVKSGKTSDEQIALPVQDKEELNPNISSEEKSNISLTTSIPEVETFSSGNSKESKNEKRFVTRLELIVDPRDSRIQFTEVSASNIESKEEKEPRTPDSLSIEDGCSLFTEKTRKVSTESYVGELPMHRERGRLDKSYSTPAYDLSGLEGLEVNQKSPAPRAEVDIADKFASVGIRPDLSNDYQAMPDITSTSSSTPIVRRTQDHSVPSAFQFPPAVKTTPSSSVKGQENQTTDDCDVNSNPVLHGRVVETINRHLLDSNCGKDGDEDCDDMRDNQRNAGFSRTLTNIVLNSPDLLSDIDTHRLYPKPDDDFDNGNHFQFSLSPRLDNCESSFDSNRNSPQTKLSFHLASQSKPTTPTSPFIEQSHKQTDSYHLSSSVDVPSPKFFKGEVKKPPPPTPPSRHHSISDTPDHPSQSTVQPKVPVKISVSPPEPPPRPNPPNKSALSDQHKSVFRTKMNAKTVGSKTVFGSPKVSRKKNTLLAKRRSVSVKELGVGEYQGWLYRRLRIGDSGAQWIKGWFILKGTTFYGFKHREANKADCFISLPGFTTSPAEEVKSRKFAFKVYHTGTVFYFAAESDEELATWLDCLSMATCALDVTTLKNSAAEGAVFSETEDEGDDEAEIADSCFPSPKMRKLTNFLSGHSNHSSNVSGAGGSPKPARSHQNLATSSDSKTYDIQKRFGSLKKLGYRSKCTNQLSSQSSSSATSLSSSEQSQEVPSAPHSLDRKVLRFLSSSKNQNIPVPTSQFKSYRRVVATDHCASFSKNSDGNSSRDESVVESTIPQTARSLNSPYGEQDVRRNNRSFGSRPDDTPNTLTLEQFMLQRQEEDRQQNQHIHSQHQDRFREPERDPASPVHREASEGL